ncbi:bifunctional N(6)-L-threonylcarbamoyladenine synthase/serine/threonine protein kinase [Candidatus Woesearchaeota archaeon]|nr:bifunctional N(6)-L-threonylcarbamoyladenine synthase/serine/threonine protein kinase [Candidatus Woesearchaeota archaeon]
MIVLGIESTAHTFGVAVLDGKKILSNVTDSYTTEKGGMIPAKVAKHHEDVYLAVLQKALKDIKLKDIELIAFSDAPGLGHTLRIGAAAAKSLALELGVPLVGVNHCIAHLEVTGLATKAKDPVLLYCSGANTQVIAYDGGKYRIFGETLDTGVGNFLDTLARMLGLGFPGGPKIEQLAKKSKNLITLPYSVKGMDVSFAGLETNLKRRIEKGESPEDLAFSAQETVFAMLVETAERAMAHTGKTELVLGGGVACNKRLQEMCSLMCEDRKAKFFCPENSLLVDNAAMIAWTGSLMYEKGGVSVSVEEARIKPYERTDDVEVTWRSE